MLNGEGRTAVGAARTSVGRRRHGARNGSKVEVGGGIDGIARPDLFPALVEGDPLAVADAVGGRIDVIMAVRAVQWKRRVWRGPVWPLGCGAIVLGMLVNPSTMSQKASSGPEYGETGAASILQRRSSALWHLRVVSPTNHLLLSGATSMARYLQLVAWALGVGTFIVIVAIVSRQVYLRSAPEAADTGADDEPATLMLIR